MLKFKVGSKVTIKDGSKHSRGSRHNPTSGAVGIVKDNSRQSPTGYVYRVNWVGATSVYRQEDLEQVTEAKVEPTKFISVYTPHVSIAGTSMGGGSWTHRLIKVRNKLGGRKCILVEVREGAYKKQVLHAVKAAICDIEKLSGKKLKVKFV